MALKRTIEDIRFSILIRCRDNWTCQRCRTKYPEKAKGLECSHFYTRGWWSTRFDEENCDALCTGCHAYFEGHPHEYQVWKEKQLGDLRYVGLIHRGNTDLRTLYNTNKKEWRKIVRKNVEKKLKKYEK